LKSCAVETACRGIFGQYRQAALDKQGTREIRPIDEYSRLKPIEIALLGAKIRKKMV